MDWGEKLELKIATLPDSPGCYLMKNSTGTVIYAGKAVNLKNRVRSYFRETGHTPKVAAMVSRVDDFDILLCDTNLEALILECNLIKKYRPYYNILLKDDKQYPYLKLDLREVFPRLTLCRRMEKDHAEYFGPYIGATAVRQVIEAVRNVFPVRTCRQKLPLKSPGRPCVNYEIGRCMAPCAGKCTAEEYGKMLRGVEDFLNGNYSLVLDSLREEMDQAAAALRYERAAVLRDRIRRVEGMMERQMAVRTDGAERDLIAIAQDGIDAMVQILYVRGGRLTGGDCFELPGEGGEDPGEVIAGFLTQYYDEARLIPRSVLCQALAEDEEGQTEAWLRAKKGEAVTLLKPKRGEKHELVLLAEKNARDALLKRNARRSVREERTTGAAERLGKALGISVFPRRIEGYDISNTQGAQSVAAMVVFVDGTPAKKEYRHFRIKTVEGPNDFESIYEVLKRRLARGLKEKAEQAKDDSSADIGCGFAAFPDLILIDGGPQQLCFAMQAAQELGLEIPMFGLAESEEEIYLPWREEPLRLDHHTPELQLVQRIRDEAHRFGITHHRALRGKAAVHSVLDDIPGIGPERRKSLLKAFGSVKAVQQASAAELAKAKGMNAAAAENVYKKFHPPVQNAADGTDKNTVSP